MDKKVLNKNVARKKNNLETIDKVHSTSQFYVRFRWIILRKTGWWYPIFYNHVNVELVQHKGFYELSNFNHI